MKKTSDKLLRISKLTIRAETVALLTPLHLAKVAGGEEVGCTKLGTCDTPSVKVPFFVAK